MLPIIYGLFENPKNCGDSTKVLINVTNCLANLAADEPKFKHVLIDSFDCFTLINELLDQNPCDNLVQNAVWLLGNLVHKTSEYLIRNVPIINKLIDKLINYLDHSLKDV